MARVSRKHRRDNPAARARQAGWRLVAGHPLFSTSAARATLHQSREGSLCPPSGWAVVTSGGVVHVHPTRRGDPAEWAWVLAHALLHRDVDHLAAAPRLGGPAPARPAGRR